LEATQTQWFFSGGDLVAMISDSLEVLERGIGTDPQWWMVSADRQDRIGDPTVPLSSRPKAGRVTMQRDRARSRIRRHVEHAGRALSGWGYVLSDPVRRVARRSQWNGGLLIEADTAEISGARYCFPLPARARKV